MDICRHIVPRQEKVVGCREDGYLAKCILVWGHPSSHVIKTPEGKYFMWRRKYGCRCCEDKPVYCFFHKELSEEEVLEILRMDFTKEESLEFLRGRG